jgi:hypothetical protein
VDGAGQCVWLQLLSLASRVCKSLQSLEHRGHCQRVLATASQ